MIIEKVFKQFPTLHSANLQFKKLKTHIYKSYLLFMIMTRYLSIVASSQNITFKLFKNDWPF